MKRLLIPVFTIVLLAGCPPPVDKDDAGTPDGSLPVEDAGITDAAVVDAAPPDGSVVQDGGALDASSSDAAPADAGPRYLTTLASLDEFRSVQGTQGEVKFLGQVEGVTPVAPILEPCMF